MKRLFFVLLPLLIISTAYGQNTEFSVHLNSGLFSFDGHSVAEHSTFVISDVGSVNHYTRNPYGSRYTFSYGMGVELHRVTSGDFLFGAQLSYERLRSKVTITEVSGEFPPGSDPSASGESTLLLDFINLYPNIGYRFNINVLDLDLSAGPDISFYVNSQEKVEVGQSGDNMLKVNNDGDNPGTDIRARAQAVLYYKHWGLSAGYSYGLNNYKSDYVGGDEKAYARFIRIGLSYRL